MIFTLKEHKSGTDPHDRNVFAVLLDDFGKSIVKHCGTQLLAIVMWGSVFQVSIRLESQKLFTHTKSVQSIT